MEKSVFFALGMSIIVKKDKKREVRNKSSVAPNNVYVVSILQKQDKQFSRMLQNTCKILQSLQSHEAH